MFCFCLFVVFFVFFYLLHNCYINSNFSILLFYFHTQLPETRLNWCYCICKTLFSPWLYGTYCIYRVLANNVDALHNMDSDKGRYRMPLSQLPAYTI